MPYLNIATNQPLDQHQKAKLLSAASSQVARALGKPEDYMMVSVDDAKPMSFAGTTTPCAFLELRSIGLPIAETGRLSALLCQLMQSELGVSSNRVYINFADVRRGQWGWNGATF
jgi:phenylpyruvate tautomerase